MNRPLTNKDLHEFNTDMLTLVLCFLYFKVKQHQSIFDYKMSAYVEVQSKLKFELVTKDNEELILITHEKCDLTLTKEDIEQVKREHDLHLATLYRETDYLDFV